MKIIGHRGASAVRPENTLAAFEEAVRIGVDAIEFDLHRTRDGRIVVLHDDLVRLDGEWRYVGELSFDELERVDAGGGERVPTLDAVLEHFRGRCDLMLEVKAFGLGVEVAQALLRHGPGPDLHVTSFLHEEVVEVARRLPGLPRSITLAAMPIRFQPLLEDAGVSEVSLFRGYVHQGIVATLAAHGVKVRVYPVNLPREAAAMAEWGVEGIFTDDPAAMQVFREGAGG